VNCILLDLPDPLTFGNAKTLLLVEFLLFSLSSSHVAMIEPARTITGKEALAPTIAVFSSRGPSIEYPEVIKVHRQESVAFTSY
jgi:hypothetical protein